MRSAAGASSPDLQGAPHSGTGGPPAEPRDAGRGAHRAVCDRPGVRGALLYRERPLAGGGAGPAPAHMTAPAIRVFVGNGHPAVREGMRTMLEHEPGIVVVDTA